MSGIPAATFSSGASAITASVVRKSAAIEQHFEELNELLLQHR